MVLHYYKDRRTGGALQRRKEKKQWITERTVKTRNKGTTEKIEHRGRMEKEEEGLCLPRRACFILGLSMVTVAVLLPLTET